MDSIVFAKPLFGKIIRLSQECRRTGDVVSLNRLESMAMIGRGMSIDTVAHIKGVSKTTLYDRLGRLVCQGPAALILKKNRRKKPGKPSSLTKNQRKRLGQIVEEGPQANGFLQSAWTLNLIQDLIHKTFGVFYCESYISKILKSLKFSYKKGSYFLARRCDQARKEWLTSSLPCLMAQAKSEGAAILFGDEVGFAIGSKAGYTWAKRGEIAWVPHPGQNFHFKLFGAIDIVNHRLSYHLSKKLNSQTFHEFLRLLLKKYQDQKVYLILDNARYHKSEYINQLAKGLSAKIELKFLPAYSPDYNPIEQLWKVIKGNYFGGFYTNSAKGLVKRILTVFRSVQQRFASYKSCYKKWDNQMSKLISFPRKVSDWIKGGLTDFFGVILGTPKALAKAG